MPTLLTTAALLILILFLKMLARQAKTDTKLLLKNFFHLYVEPSHRYGIKFDFCQCSNVGFRGRSQGNLFTFVYQSTLHKLYAVNSHIHIQCGSGDLT